VVVWHRGQSLPVPEIGETYGCRARAVDDLVPVRVLKQGNKKPARVLIRFEDPAMEGREEWALGRRPQPIAAARLRNACRC
jgi:hypothetical protein